MKNTNILPARTYDLIFSLGAACPCTDLLRSLRLQDWSYPFDWVFGSDFAGRVDILVDEFDRWFERGDFKLLEQTSVSHHSVWINTKTQIIYNHDFRENTSDIDASYDAVREKYDRRTKRLMAHAARAQRMAIVYLDRPDAKNPTAAPDDIIRGYNKIRAKYDGKRALDLYYVHHDGAADGATIRRLADGVYYITLDYHAAGQEDWAVDLGKLRPMFGGLRLHRPVFKRIRRMFCKLRGRVK